MDEKVKKLEEICDILKKDNFIRAKDDKIEKITMIPKESVSKVMIEETIKQLNEVYPKNEIQITDYYLQKNPETNGTNLKLRLKFENNFDAVFYPTLKENKNIADLVSKNDLEKLSENEKENLKVFNSILKNKTSEYNLFEILESPNHQRKSLPNDKRNELLNEGNKLKKEIEEPLMNEIFIGKEIAFSDNYKTKCESISNFQSINAKDTEYVINARFSERGLEVDREISLSALGSGNIRINSNKNLSSISELKDKFQKIVAISDFKQLNNEKGVCSVGEAFSAAFSSFNNSEISKTTMQKAGFSSKETMNKNISKWLEESRKQNMFSKKKEDLGRER